MRIAFFGLGKMGIPMVRRLIQGDHQVVGFDLSPEAQTRLVDERFTFGETPEKTAIDADIIITMLPNEKAVEQALFGASGAVKGLRSGALLLEMSTSDANYIHCCAERLSALGIRSMDVPVCRGMSEAARGELLVLAGGESDDLATAMPVLSQLGKEEDILHVGPLGTAIRLKLINNYISMVNMVVAAEGLTFARLAGIDREIAMRVFGSTPAGKGQMLTNFPRKVLRGDVTPEFPLKMGLKDITLALKLGDQLGAPLFIGAAARQSFGLAAPWGRSEEDCTSMLHVLEDIAGLRPA